MNSVIVAIDFAFLLVVETDASYYTIAASLRKSVALLLFLSFFKDPIVI